MSNLDKLSIAKILSKNNNAWKLQKQFLPIWKECIEFGLPNYFLSDEYYIKNNRLFDSTAPDSIELLANNILTTITPKWTQWFDVTSKDNRNIKNESDCLEIEEIISKNFNSSNFFTEIHQAYLELICTGTAVILFEANSINSNSAFYFKSLPIINCAILENERGEVSELYYKSSFPIERIIHKYKKNLSDEDYLNLQKIQQNSENKNYTVVQAVIKNIKNNFEVYTFITTEDNPELSQSILLDTIMIDSSPFIAFRWLKTANSPYGRSALMKALPDIKTINKAIELTLKNASLAVAGIWQADDDGILDISNIKLQPGAIIPKSIGSQGLTPLKTNNNFDISQLVVGELRQKIRQSILGDSIYSLSNYDNNAMTATEVNQRSANFARSSAATFTRLQNELLYPLLQKAVDILIKRSVFNNDITIKPIMPLERIYKRNKANDLLLWLSSISSLSQKNISKIDMDRIIEQLANYYSVDISAFLKSDHLDAIAHPDAHSDKKTTKLNDDYDDNNNSNAQEISKNLNQIAKSTTDIDLAQNLDNSNLAFKTIS